MYGQPQIGPNFAGIGEFDESLNPFGPSFIPGPEDNAYFTILRLMSADQPAAVLEMSNYLGHVASQERTDTEKLELGSAFATFLNDNTEPTITEDLADFFGALFDAPEDEYFDLLEQANNSEFCRDHPWFQRLLSVMLFTEQDELERQNRSIIVTNAKNVFGALKSFADHRLGR